MNGLELKNSRKKLKLSQEELGEQLGLSKNTIYNYENGGVIPKSKIPKLIDFFKDKTISHNIGDLKIPKKEVLKIIETLYLHEEELMKYESFSLWVDSKKAEERNNLLKEMLQKKLNSL